MPEPLAIPPIVISRPLMPTRAAASLGKGSVVMIACAASDPSLAPRAWNATGNPFWILSIGSATPITPVDATSTCSTGQPTRRAVSAVIVLASRSPASPVQALAHPLLTTTARATPPDRERCSRDTVTGAACARFVVKTAAAVAGWSEISNARSRAPGLALIPALTPAARNPFGVATPPPMVSIV